MHFSINGLLSQDLEEGTALSGQDVVSPFKPNKQTNKTKKKERRKKKERTKKKKKEKASVKWTNTCTTMVSWKIDCECGNRRLL